MQDVHVLWRNLQRQVGSMTVVLVGLLWEMQLRVEMQVEMRVVMHVEMREKQVDVEMRWAWMHVVWQVVEVQEVVGQIV